MEEENKEASPQLCNALLDLHERLYYKLLLKSSKELADEKIEDIFNFLIEDVPGFVKHLKIRMNDKENVSAFIRLKKFHYLLDENKE